MKDVIIVGGGVIGVCTAWYLHQEGLDITVIDQGDLASGCAYGNAGMIVPSHIVPLASPGMIAKGLRWMFQRSSPFFIRPRVDPELLRWLWLFYKSATKSHVMECAPLLRDMHQEGRSAFETWSHHPDFDFDFAADGILMLYNSSKGEEDELSAAAFANELGVDAIPLTGESLYNIEPLLKKSDVGGVHYPGDATLSPDKFMHQMIAWLQSAGVQFLAQTKVAQLIDNGENSCAVQCADGAVYNTKHIIVANGVWSKQLLKSVGTYIPMQDGKGYSMTIDRNHAQPRIPSILHEARVAVTPLKDRFRISGTLEISGLDDRIRSQKLAGIINSLPGYYEGVQFSKPEKAWFGYRPCTPHGMPLIGSAKPGSSIMLATGHAMMGLSLAPATGRMISDLIVKGVRIPSLLDPLG